MELYVRFFYAFIPCTGIKLYLLPARLLGWQRRFLPFICVKELLVHSPSQYLPLIPHCDSRNDAIRNVSSMSWTAEFRFPTRTVVFPLA
jgi:hypothetical protein